MAYYRGPRRNSSVAGVKLAEDWKTKPPKIVWEHACGPGWGSMCVVNKVLFTQEQRGDAELVIAYDATTGKELWRHNDPVRFDEVVAGTGPRATPAYDQGRVYTYGSKANVNCLDAATGKVVWKRDLLKDYQLAIPMWAYSTSPVVAAGNVYLYMDLPKAEVKEGAAEDDSSKADAASLIALDAATGKTVWQLPITGQNYSSVEPITLGSETVLLFGTDQALLTIDPRDGRVLNSQPIPRRQESRRWCSRSCSVMVVCSSRWAMGRGWRAISRRGAPPHRRGSSNGGAASSSHRSTTLSYTAIMFMALIKTSSRASMPKRASNAGSAAAMGLASCWCSLSRVICLSSAKRASWCLSRPIPRPPRTWQIQRHRGQDVESSGVGGWQTVCPQRQATRVRRVAAGRVTVTGGLRPTL